MKWDTCIGMICTFFFCSQSFACLISPNFFNVVGCRYSVRDGMFYTFILFIHRDQRSLVHFIQFFPTNCGRNSLGLVSYSMKGVVTNL
uniref:Uncharacterized protein n=1 Tax=Arundo donax TaxID=35708 RepID=A0A0A8XPZ0_ARUDO